MSAALLKRVNADIESRQAELNSLKTAVPTSVSADRIVDFVLATDEPFSNPEASLQWKTSNDKSPCCVIS